MKKYLREIEISGIILLFVGAMLNWTGRKDWAVGVVVIGIALWVVQVVVKAFNWQEYRRDNMVNLAVMIGAILAIYITMFMTK